MDPMAPINCPARPVLCLIIFMFIRSMIQSRQPFPGWRPDEGRSQHCGVDGAFVKDGLTLVDFYATWCPPRRLARRSAR